MSPEQARGESEPRPAHGRLQPGSDPLRRPDRSDSVYGRPARGLEPDRRGRPDCARRLDHDIPADLETICLKAMAKEPARRYQTAREFGDDLNRWLIHETIHARPATPLERTWRWCQRRPSVAVLALAFLLAVAGGVSGIAWKWTEAVAERRRAELKHDRALRNFRDAQKPSTPI